MPKCGDCSWWHNRLFQKRCPRMAKSVNRAEAMIRGNAGKNERLRATVFPGVAVWDDGCEQFLLASHKSAG